MKCDQLGRRLIISVVMLYSLAILSISVIFAGLGIPVAETARTAFFCVNAVAVLSLIGIGIQAIYSTYPMDSEQPK